jgi:chaperonin GroEL (HSP60 family)
MTYMVSKLVSTNSKELADLIVDAVLSVVEEYEENKRCIDVDNIKVEKKTGNSINDSKLIKGIVLDKEVVHGGMPKRIEDAKIALINTPFEIEKTEFDAKINIDSPDRMQKFLEEENRMLKNMVEKVRSVGANVVFCQKDIDEIVQHYLAKSGILAVRRIKESDMYKLSFATGGRLLSNIDELSEEDLGESKLVEERKVETDKWVFVEGCKNPKSVSMLVRGGSQRIIDEVERSVRDALMTIKDVMEYPYVIIGGGAPEATVAQIREWSNSLSGRSQLVVEKFADSIETILLVLAENAGMDIVDTQVQLRSKSNTSKAKYGIDINNGKVADLTTYNIYEPLAVKEQVINTATEASCMILRIDDIISAGKSKGGPPAGGAGNPYSGGIPDMEM